MEKRPAKLCAMIDGILTAAVPEQLKERATFLMRELTVCFHVTERALKQEKKPADAETLSGTYEEMYSNWHGKMLAAARFRDRHLAFMSLESMNEMLNDIAGETDIGSYDVLSVYDPEDLDRSADGCDAVLRDYLREYEKAGLKPERYADIDLFLSAYLKPIRHT